MLTENKPYTLLLLGWLRSSYEKDPESGLYYAGARYQVPRLGSFNSTDPLWWKSPDKTSYHYCANNPIMFVDPDGRDWIVADGTTNYQWRDDINAKSKLPEGYTYVGVNNSDILSHMGMNYKFSELNTSDVGMVASDAELGKYAVSHLVGVKERSNAIISVNVSYDKDNSIANNVLGRTFNGISINVTEISSTSGVDGDMMGGGFVSAQYGNKTYEATLKSPNYTYYHAPGTTVTEANINIPKSDLSVGAKFSQIQVRGNWFIKKPEGITPVVRHSLIPYPISFKHTWKFK